ncbi:MAG: TolC family protein [Acidobacteriota bacterium]|nr:TolC family protein [Acidobacteriota bacterium]
MLRITTEQASGKPSLTVEGKLAGPWVAALEQSWNDLRNTSPGQNLSVNLCGVSFIDAAGKALLKQIHQQGGKLVAEGCLNQAIVREIAAGKSTGKIGEAHAKKTPIIFYVLFLGLSVTSAGSLRAQTAAGRNALPSNAPTEVLRLTLDQAVALALKQNTTAQVAVIQAAEAVQDKNVARAALLPQANLEASDSIRRSNIETNFGKPIPGFPQHIGPIQVFQVGPSFSAPVFDLTLWRRYQAQRSLANAAKANSLSTREQVVLLVVSQYIGTLRDIATVQAASSRVELAQALYNQAADLQKEGVGTGIDTLRSNVELQNEKQRFLEAEASRETSLYALSRLLNLDPRQTIELADSLSYFETPQPEVEQSLEQALSVRQEWKALNEQIKAAQSQKKQAWDTRLPALKVDGEWAYQGTRLNNGIPTYNYEVALSMPLFTGGRIRAETTRADLEIQRLKEQQADLRNEIGLDVKTALINLTSAKNEVQVANLGVQLSKEEVDQARDRFRAGVANNIEVIQAQDSLARANNNQIAALYRFNQARADLARSVGQMERVYAK